MRSSLVAVKHPCKKTRLGCDLYDNMLMPPIASSAEPSGNINPPENHDARKGVHDMSLPLKPWSHLPTFLRLLDLHCQCPRHGVCPCRRYNKNVLKVFPYPITCTVLQFGVGSLLALAMWTLGLYPKPEINRETVSSQLRR